MANIALGIGNAIAALASNMMTAFHNAICSIQSWFYNLLSTALSVIEGICAALNKLPFVEFDYSGISSAADDYAAKASEAAGNKEDYQSISDAFNEGFTTFDAFQDGWASERSMRVQYGVTVMLIRFQTLVCRMYSVRQIFLMWVITHQGSMMQ